MKILKMKNWLILGAIPIAAFATPDTVTVPLVPIMHNAGYGFGINLSVGGGPESLCLVDTGSSGLYISDGQVGSGASEVMPPVPFSQSYASGNAFKGVDYQGTVTFSDAGLTADNIIFGDITCATGPNYGFACSFMMCPNASMCFPTMGDTPPLYGTCGIGLRSGKVSQGSLYSILAQLPDNLSSGFIVASGGISGTPMLIIGLTEANTQGFITAQLTQDGTYLNGNTAWDDRSLTVITNLSSSGVQQTIIGPVLFDTGEADARYYENSATPPTTINPVFVMMGQLRDGVKVNNVVDNGINWSVVAGMSEGQNIFNVTNNTNDVFMNAGLTPFFTYDILYDIKNGLLGFRPIAQQNVSGLPDNTNVSESLGDLNGIPTSLVQMGPGNVILSGVNTYSNGTILVGGQLTISANHNLGMSGGGITFNGGTLNVTDDYSTSRSIAVFSNGGVFNTNEFTSTLTGPFNGTGTLGKIGEGTLIFSASEATYFSGVISIEEGIFIAEAALPAATIDVGPSGTLMGTGPVDNVVSSGFVIAGQPSPGTLSIIENYTQTSSGSLIIQFASLTDYNQLSVGGTAQLGGTLQPESYQGFLPSPGDTFTIITAGSITGQFSNFGLLWPTLAVVPIYNRDPSVMLLISRNYANPALGPLNRNQTALANMLNKVIANPTVAPLLDLLNGVSTAPALLNGYDELIPSQYLSQITTSFYRTTLTLENIEKRLYNCCGCERLDDNLFNVEVRALLQDHHRTELENAFFAEGGQVDVEFDHRFTQHFSAGLYGDYTFLHSSFRRHPGTIDDNSGALMAYGCYQAHHWYSDLIFGGIYNSYDNKRKIDITGTQATAKSHNHAFEVAGLGNVGYEVCSGDWSVAPNLFLQFEHNFSSSFKEHGSSLFDMQGKIRSANSLQPGLGLDVRRYFYIVPERCSFFEVYANWRYECLHARYSMKSHLLGVPVSFKTVSSKPHTSLGFVGANLNLAVTRHIDCSLIYQGLFAGHSDWMQSASVGLSFAF